MIAGRLRGHGGKKMPHAPMLVVHRDVRSSPGKFRGLPFVAVVVSYLGAAGGAGAAGGVGEGDGSGGIGAMGGMGGMGGIRVSLIV